MKVLRLMLLVGLVGVFYSCGSSPTYEEVAQEDIDFASNATLESSSDLSSTLEDPGSPVVDRRVGGFGGIFVYGVGSNDYLLGGIDLSYCVTHSNPNRVDADGDKVFDRDTITFNCPDTSATVLDTLGRTYTVEYSINGQVIHNDENDNDPFVLSVSWGTPFTYNIVIKDSSGQIVYQKTRNVEGSHSFARDGASDTTILFSHERRSFDSNGREFYMLVNGTLYVPLGWYPGTPLTQSISKEFTGSGYVKTPSGRQIDFDISTTQMLVISPACQGLNARSIESGQITMNLSVSGQVIKTIVITYTNCEANVTVQ